MKQRLQRRISSWKNRQREGYVETAFPPAVDPPTPTPPATPTTPASPSRQLATPPPPPLDPLTAAYKSPSTLSIGSIGLLALKAPVRHPVFAMAAEELISLTFGVEDMDEEWERLILGLPSELDTTEDQLKLSVALYLVLVASFQHKLAGWMRGRALVGVTPAEKHTFFSSNMDARSFWRRLDTMKNVARAPELRLVVTALMAQHAGVVDMDYTLEQELHRLQLAEKDAEIRRLRAVLAGLVQQLREWAPVEVVGPSWEDRAAAVAGVLGHASVSGFRGEGELCVTSPVARCVLLYL